MYENPRYLELFRISNLFLLNANKTIQTRLKGSDLEGSWQVCKVSSACAFVVLVLEQKQKHSRLTNNAASDPRRRGRTSASSGEFSRSRNYHQ